VRVFIWSMQRRRQWCLAAVCVLMGVLFLVFGQAAATGVKRGLAVCGQLLIPSLFPFMMLSDFIIRSGLADSIGRYTSGIMRVLFGFSGSAAVAVVISMLGGYPAGAAAVNGLVSRGDIAPTHAKRLLRSCVNAGPAFVIGGVGVGMLGSAKAGLLLLCAHWASSLIVSFIDREPYVPTPRLRAPVPKTSAAVAASVHAASAALLSMCGFVLAASALLSLTDALGGATVVHSAWRCAFTCLLEVTGGCMEATEMGPLAPFWLGAALGFGGLSVHGQIAAVTAEYGLVDKAFFRARILHALLGGCLSFVLFAWLKPLSSTVAASAMLSSVTPRSDEIGMTALVAMMLMCVIFLQTLPKKSR